MSASTAPFPRLSAFPMGHRQTLAAITAIASVSAEPYNRHLDYGYAVTSHSSQGQTADRVLVHVDTHQTGEKLVNRRLACVALSRGRYDAQLYTNDAAKLSEALSRDVSKHTAIRVQGVQFAVKQESAATVPQGEEVGQGQAHGQRVGQGTGSRGQS